MALKDKDERDLRKKNGQTFIRKGSVYRTTNNKYCWNIIDTYPDGWVDIRLKGTENFPTEDLANDDMCEFFEFYD